MHWLMVMPHPALAVQACAAARVCADMCAGVFRGLWARLLSPPCVSPLCLALVSRPCVSSLCLVPVCLTHQRTAGFPMNLLHPSARPTVDAGPGFGVAACPALGLLVTSNHVNNTVTVFDFGTEGPCRVRHVFGDSTQDIDSVTNLPLKFMFVHVAYACVRVYHVCVVSAVG